MHAHPFLNTVVWRGSVGLGRGDVVSLHNARGTVLEVASGGVWVTEESEGGDRMVLAGECVRLDDTGKTVISARQGARLRLIAASDGGARLCVERSVQERDARGTYPASPSSSGLLARVGSGLRGVAKRWMVAVADSMHGWAATH